MHAVTVLLFGRTTRFGQAQALSKPTRDDYNDALFDVTSDKPWWN
ncbi:hypothetical protein AERO9A_310025 [Aeromonas salmonicida]|nr:hypothetical protein AERO9A_310025 [Aeromonas salmonicida]